MTVVEVAGGSGDGAVYGSAEWLSLVVHTVIHCFFFFFCEIMPLRMDGVWLCFLFSLFLKFVTISADG